VSEQQGQLTSAQILDMSVTSLDDDKAKDLITIPLAGKTSIADHLVIASGNSQRQVVAMAEHLVTKLKQAGLVGVSIEGKTGGDWVVIDAFDVIIHIFRPEVREFYNLEKMWNVELPSGGGASEHIG
jgi:ribosome-associated protein